MSEHQRQANWKQYLGHPQAHLTTLTRKVYSNQDCEQDLGEVVVECRQKRSDREVKFTIAFSSIPIGMLLATFSAIAVAFMCQFFNLIQEKGELATWILVGGAVQSPFWIGLYYWYAMRNFRRFRLTLHTTGLRYAVFFWRFEDVVAIRPGSSVLGPDELPVLSLFCLLSPGSKRGFQEYRASTFHLELSDGSQPNLLNVFPQFRTADVHELLYRISLNQPEIHVAPELLASA